MHDQDHAAIRLSNEYHAGHRMFVQHLLAHLLLQ